MAAINNSNAESVTTATHGGAIDIQGVTVAVLIYLNHKFPVTKLEKNVDEYQYGLNLGHSQVIE
jgi:hypothetical protein